MLPEQTRRDDPSRTHRWVLLIASVLAGYLWDSIGPGATFLAGAVFTALGLAGLSLLPKASSTTA